MLAAPAIAQSQNGADSVFVFGGWASETDFTTIVSQPWTAHLNGVGLIGASYSHRLGTVNELLGDFSVGRVGDFFSIEVEGGISGRFGDESLGEAWAALYVRYDGMPWNDFVYTTFAASTGLSVLTEVSEFELSREGKATEMLHYFSPELTFADPDNKDLELVLRLHHRSGIFGIFDGISTGSTFIGLGIRMRY